MLRRSFLFLCVLAILALAAGPALAVQYTLTDLGDAIANGINESGQVTGWSGEAAFIWTNGTMTNLHDPIYEEEEACSVGRGINDNGYVVGYICDYMSEVQGAAISDGVNPMQFMLGTSYESDAYAINNDKLVVGVSQSHAFVYDVDNTTLTSLGNVGVLASCWTSQANDINENDDVVGYGRTSSDSYVPFRYSGSVMTDLSTVITGAKTAEAINENGWIVGKADTSNFASGAYLWNGTTSVDLGKTGTYDTVPYDVNNNGLVVGGATDSHYSDAFLYDSNTATLSKLYDLLSTAEQANWYKLLYATGINDDGQICGYGVTSDYRTHAFVLTPVPEPSTMALAALGLMGLLCYAWRKRS